MGRNLSNLYISESFQYLIQVSGSELQTGLGSTLTGSLLITASKADTATTASYVLNAISSSFAITASYALNAGATVSTASLLTTASATNNVITFTKGDGSTFPITVATGSAISTGSFMTTGSVNANILTFTKGDGSTFSLTVATGSAVSASFATTASLALNNVLTASVNSNTITFTKGDGTTFPITVNTGSAVTVNTGSLLVTASISNATTTFTKGDGSTFSITANNVVNANSASVATSASYALSASFATNALSASYAPSVSPFPFTGSAIISGSLGVTGSSNFTGGDFKVTDQTRNGEFDVDKVIIKTQGGTQFTGSVSSQNGFTGSLQGTASFATSASYALSSSFSNTATSASYALTSTSSSFAINATSASYAVSASQAQNAVSASYAPAGNPFPFTGSAEITGSLTVTGSVDISNQLKSRALVVGDNNNTGSGFFNSIAGGQNNNIGSNIQQTIIFANGATVSDGTQFSQLFGSSFNKIGYGYSHIFGGYANNVGGTSPGGPNGDVYQAGIYGGQDNNVWGFRTNNQTIFGGSSNNIYVTNSVSDFLNNSVIVGGYNNYLRGTARNSAIISSLNSLMENYTSSVIIGGSNITASAHNTVFVPDLNVSGAIIEQGSSTSVTPAMILGSGSGRPLFAYMGGGINPTFDSVEGNTSINHFINGGNQCFTYMGLNNQFVFGYNYPNPTLEVNANNYGKFYYGLQVSQSLGVTGSLTGTVNALNIISNTASLDCSSGNFFTLNLADASNTYINPTNVSAGQTINIKIINGPVGSATVTFPTSVKQASGSAYVPTAATNAVDVITLVSFDNSDLYLSNIKNFI